MPFFYFCWGEIMTYDYIGWVPCVSGRLFFEYTFPGLGTPKCSINHVEQNNESTSYHRYIIVSSVVDWKDGKEKGSSGRMCSIVNSPRSFVFGGFVSSVGLKLLEP